VHSNIKNIIGEAEIYQSLKDTIDESQNILIVLDEMMPEFEEITKTYTDTWDKVIKVILVKLYENKEGNVITVTPDFEKIEYIDAPEMEEEDLVFLRLFPIIHDLLRLFPIIHDLLRLFPTQSATATSPKSQKQPKISLFKMQQRIFFFYHTIIITRQH